MYRNSIPLITSVNCTLMLCHSRFQVPPSLSSVLKSTIFAQYFAHYFFLVLSGDLGVMLDSVQSVTGKVQYILAPKGPSSAAKHAKQTMLHCSFSHLANEKGPFGTETRCLTE